MKYRICILSLVSVLVISSLSAYSVLAQPGGKGKGNQQGGMQRGGPPQEALTACQGKQEGSSCQFTSPHGTISGTCRVMQKQAACVPEGMGPGGQQGGPGGQQGGPGGQQGGPGGQQGGPGGQQQGQQRPMMQQNSQSFAPFTDAKPLSNRVVDTGQDRCYNALQEIECPSEGSAFFGQDAHYLSKAPAYRNNGDGTVTDLNTGLMWQNDPGAKMTYSEAVKNVSSFRLGGYSDWRLPTIKELYSLIRFDGLDVSGWNSNDTSGLSPFIDTDFFVFEYGDTNAGERIIDSQYISATKYVSTTMNKTETAFGVNFADGRIKGYGLNNPRGGNKTFFVLYVRGNSGYGTNNFQDHGNGTITDTSTGLMWMQFDSGKGMAWEQALGYCETLQAAGNDDWRLPNAKELQYIVDYTRSPATTKSAAIDPLFKTSTITDEGGKQNYPFYWTSTTHANMRAGGNAAYIAFGEALGWMKFPNGEDYTLMDVHGAGAQRSDPKTGDASSYPHGHGPQGDVIRINNYVRCVRN